MSDQKVRIYRCFNCGEIVGKNDWAYMGRRATYVCNKAECNQEMEAQDRAILDEEREEALRHVEEEFGRW